MPYVSRDLLLRLEWAGCVGPDSEMGCPDCGAEANRFEGPGFTGRWIGDHAPDCELSAALATPEGRPAVAVGDWVLTRFLGGTIIPVKAASVIEVIDPAGITEIRGERNGQPFIWRKEA